MVKLLICASHMVLECIYVKVTLVTIKPNQRLSFPPLKEVLRVYPNVVVLSALSSIVVVHCF